MQEQKVLLISDQQEVPPFWNQLLMSEFNLTILSVKNYKKVTSYEKYACVLIDEKKLKKEELNNIYYYFLGVLSCPIIPIHISDSLDLSTSLANILKGNLLKNEDNNKIENYKEKHSYKTISSEYSQFSRMIQKACETDTTILLLGESGSGKDYMAKYIHEHSSRKNCPYINKNVAEINPNLIESELFGTKEGAFTGAQEKEGIFGEAKNGTLFLDEIAELSLEMQAKLLGVLDKKTFNKVGSTKEQNINARLIFATDADLDDLISQKKFKAQLYYRISVFIIHVPPLREHMEDLPKLCKQFASDYNKTVSENSLIKLRSYSWPGNIRQLKNCIHRACISSDTDIIEPQDIIFY